MPYFGKTLSELLSMFLLSPYLSEKKKSREDKNNRFVMYCGDGVIISHYKSATKKCMFTLTIIIPKWNAGALWKRRRTLYTIL